MTIDRLIRACTRLLPWLVLPAVTLAVLQAPRPIGEPTKLLRSPTVSATHIAFAYANNIWIVERAGGTARRLTSFQGADANPQLLARRHGRSRSAATTPATPTSTSCRPRAASRSG